MEAQQAAKRARLAQAAPRSVPPPKQPMQLPKQGLSVPPPKQPLKSKDKAAATQQPVTPPKQPQQN
eukprot:2504510-Karenia_brevis.AAC.1